MNFKNIITIESDKRGGKPCIRGMRITIEDILEYLASGMSEDEILANFPYLTRDDITACLVFGVDGEKVSAKVGRLQYDLLMKKSPQERAALAGEMFMADREIFLKTLPKNLPDKEIKKRLYFHTYGEHLPEDFFR
jgi:uncharacterized protein (DUF433 family)